MLLYKVIFKVESVQIHKDRKGESKGIAYVKFSKTSEAALAVEEMNGRCIGQHPRPLKVCRGFRGGYVDLNLFCFSGNGSPR